MLLDVHIRADAPTDLGTPGDGGRGLHQLLVRLQVAPGVAFLEEKSLEHLGHGPRDADYGCFWGLLCLGEPLAWMAWLGIYGSNSRSQLVVRCANECVYITRYTSAVRGSLNEK